VTLDIALLLGQDGLVNGAIYALLALALVLLFSVTRITFIPQGEFVAYGGLTLAALQAGKVPGTLGLLLAASAVVAVLDGWAAIRARSQRRVLEVVGWNVAYPAALWLVLRFAPFGAFPAPLQIVLALALVVPLGPALYRIAYQRLAGASVLVLLIVSIAIHIVLVGIGLLFFGAEGSRTRAFSEARLDLGATTVNVQSILVVVFSAVLILALYLFFERTQYGKALRASAMNRVGARLVGIPASLSGRLSFALAALVGSFSGMLIAPITTLYYDTGFLIGLKGFVGAILGGLSSYPLAALGAVLVGLIEAWASYYASAYKESIVFTLIVPALLWRSLRTRHVEEDE
jgi:branched-chain amino acid transport system permease protein